MATRKQLTGRLHVAAMAYAKVTRKMANANRAGSDFDLLRLRSDAHAALLEAALDYGKPVIAKPQPEGAAA
jgi:hypothetical protein